MFVYIMLVFSMLLSQIFILVIQRSRARIQENQNTIKEEFEGVKVLI